MITIGERIKSFRVQKGFSLRELGEKVNLSDTALSKIETGKTKSPGIDVALKIANALDTNVYELFGEGESKIFSISEERIILNEISNFKNDFKRKLIEVSEDFVLKEELRLNRLAIQLEADAESDPEKKQESKQIHDQLFFLGEMRGALLKSYEKFGLLTREEYFKILPEIYNENTIDLTEIVKFRDSLSKK